MFCYQNLSPSFALLSIQTKSEHVLNKRDRNRNMKAELSSVNQAEVMQIKQDRNREMESA